MRRAWKIGPCAAWAAAVLLLGWAGPAVAKAPVVVVTVRPVASLVAAIMQGIGAPVTLIPADQRPEDFSLHDQDEETLRQADLVFWVGPSLEGELVKPFANLEIGARIAELDDTPGLLLFQRRHSEEWQVPPSALPPPPPGSLHADSDGHIWLDADNMKLLVGRIADALIDVDFADAEVYRSNAESLRKRIDGLDRELSSSLAALHDKPFLQTHDDFQYFEARYDLSGVGSLGFETAVSTDSPGKVLAQRVARLHVVCIVGDDPGDGIDLRALGSAAGVATARIDPYGGAFTEGPDLYFEVLRGIADQFKSCLGGSS
jgi:zinc transport system substrate-binding protein